MSVNQHLSDEQIATWLMDEDQASSSAHLADCPDCRREAESVKAAVAGLRAALEAAVPRNLSWEAAATSPRPRRFAWPRLAASLAAAAALVALASTLLVRPPQPAPSNAREDADDALLVAIQRDVGRHVPLALAPVQSIADERATIIIANSNRQSANSNRRVNK